MSAPQIPGYRFIEHLGSGGFADVFLYEQQWPAQRVAIKVVRPDIPLTDREKHLFTIEANAMARLADHPYIVSVTTAGVTQDSGRPYLVMRYCPPPDLGIRVRSNPMSIRDAVSTGIKLASAIETAHRSGILHRDIKPSNVLVTTYHEPALSDFGIAGKISDVEGDSDVRISYPWAPPELLDGRSNGSVSSDVYSLGATIWHLLVGRSPFSIPSGDNSTRALSARILHAAPPATQRPDAPAALDALLQQCLAKRPEHRPASALELARSLQRIEEAAGWPATAIAVQGDLVATEATSSGSTPRHDEGATVVKAPAVIHASSARPMATSPVSSAPDGADDQPRGRVWAWSAAGVALALAVGGFLVFGPERAAAPAPPTDPTSATPAPVVADVLTQAPTVRATRNGDRVKFVWDSRQEVAQGDLWLVQRDREGPYDTVEGTSLTLTSTEGVCLSVKQQRGHDTSPPASTCIG